ISQQAAEDGQNQPRERWRRAIFYAGRLQDGNAMLSRTATVNSDAGRKRLDTQHWLELVDPKHRYGANRLNYLVEIDNEGKLRWARNGNLVDTTAGHWKDVGGGGGIVAADSKNEKPDRTLAAPRQSFSGSSHSDAVEEEEAMHYVVTGEPKNPIKRFLWKHFTLHGILDKLLRKTIRKNTWIYVSDKNFNIFIGLKGMSTWRHTHTFAIIWRALQHFRRFLAALEERGVDMEKVHVSKAELVLWG
ncbi:hypothetical protein OBBRIDRAFT_721984, partial [Obba rivulosa]